MQLYFLNVLLSLLDIIGLSTLVPILMLAIDNHFLEKSSKLRWVYKQLHFSQEAHFLVFLLLSIIAFYICKALLAAVLKNKTKKLAVQISEHISSQCFKAIFQKRGYEEHSKSGLGFQDQIIFTPFYFVSGIFLPSINVIAEIAVVFFLIVVFALYKPIVLLLLVGLLGSSFFFINRYIRNKITTLGKEGAAYRDKLLRESDFGISGFIDILNSRATDFFLSRFNNTFRQFASSGINAITYQLVPARINEFVALIGICGLVIYAYFFGSNNLGEIRVLAAIFVISVFRLVPAANRLLQALMHIKLNQYTIADIENQQKNEPLLEEVNNRQKFDYIQFSGITFSYAGQPIILDNLDFQLKQHNIIGIQGESGIGKTTLFKILLGFVHCQSLKITMDNELVSIHSITNMMSYVGQQPYLFEATLAENIAMGTPQKLINNEKLWDCILKSNLAHTLDLKSFHSASNYKVQAQGNNLSAGQKQRVAIARALYMDTPILLLDEPTSSLDVENEKTIKETLQTLKKLGKCIIIVAHRPNIFEICDLVYTLQQGKLVHNKTNTLNHKE